MFVVETGAGLADATSYISEDYLWAYVAGTGATVGTGDPQASLIRASAWIDARYGGRFLGIPLNGRSQGLAWPRSAACDARGYPIPSDEVPKEVQRATAEAALREMTLAGSLNPDVSGDPAVRREEVGSLKVEYAAGDGGRAVPPKFPVIDGMLAPLLGWSSNGIVLVRA